MNDLWASDCSRAIQDKVAHAFVAGCGLTFGVLMAVELVVLALVTRRWRRVIISKE